MTSAGVTSGADGFKVWPADDSLRLLCLLQACNAVPLALACQETRRQYSELVALQRKVETDPEKFQPLLEVNAALASLNCALGDVQDASALSSDTLGAVSSFDKSLNELANLETALHTEMWYLYGPDWELKPGKLISRKGTWLKKSTRFSWEVAENDKLYCPHGLAMPMLQIGKITSQVELTRHEWSGQHRSVWLTPAIIRSLEARRGVWFVFGPHWEVVGNEIIATVDTWVKRSCQMSGELQPFEMIYMPKDLSMQLACQPELVEEEWEKFRHPHVQQHRKITLASAPLTVKQEKYDIFVGQAEGNYK